jgi:hypothetical protein
MTVHELLVQVVAFCHDVVGVLLEEEEVSFEDDADNDVHVDDTAMDEVA